MEKQHLIGNNDRGNYGVAYGLISDRANQGVIRRWRRDRELRPGYSRLYGQGSCPDLRYSNSETMSRVLLTGCLQLRDVPGG
jgi:hypothetical protein